MTETSYAVTTTVVLLTLIAGEAFRVVRRRDVDFFFGAMFTVINPLFMVFAAGHPFHDQIVMAVIGCFYFWRWWKHRNDDDDDDRGRRWRAWAKAKLAKVDGRPVRVPVTEAS